MSEPRTRDQSAEYAYGTEGLVGERYGHLLRSALIVMAEIDDEQPGTESLDSLFDAEPEASDFWNKYIAGEIDA